MSHVFIVWGYCWEIKWKGQWNTRISGPMYMISSVAKFGNVLPNLWMLELRAIFIFCGKVGNGWIERTFLIRSFDSERALKLCRNVGKKLYLWWKFICLMKRKEREQAGTWSHLWSKDRRGEEWYDRGQTERWTRLVSGLHKAWTPNPVCQFGARRINYHFKPLLFNQIVIVVSRTILWQTPL